MSKPQPRSQTAPERRASEDQLRNLVAKLAPAQDGLVATMRRRLRKRLPTAHEIVYEYRDCVVLSFSPNEHGYLGVLAIRAAADGVELHFNRGKELPDPDKLLRGSGTQTRSILVESTATLARPAVADLIEAAIARAAAPFAPTGRGPIVVRATTASKRRKPAKAKPSTKGRKQAPPKRRSRKST